MIFLKPPSLPTATTPPISDDAGNRNRNLPLMLEARVRGVVAVKATNANFHFGFLRTRLGGSIVVFAAAALGVAVAAATTTAGWPSSFAPSFGFLRTRFEPNVFVGGAVWCCCCCWTNSSPFAAASGLDRFFGASIFTLLLPTASTVPSNPGPGPGASSRLEPPGSFVPRTSTAHVFACCCCTPAITAASSIHFFVLAQLTLRSEKSRRSRTSWMRS